MSEFENDERVDKPSKNEIHKQILKGLTLNSSYIPPIINDEKEPSAKSRLKEDVNYKKS